VSQLPPLRPVLGNGDPLIEILRNALTFERVLQRPATSHLWTTNRSRMRYPTSNQSVTSVAPGSWAYVRRGQPNECNEGGLSSSLKFGRVITFGMLTVLGRRIRLVHRPELIA